ncbi:MAG: hypothetical protein KatS3mg003_1577 [Candidatus Nitrosocaldaceae archaeon]|nr:MAG: hypothetical protein KatS3mg003_1577 [Candidatus Nitrosocaldaceae archaeon]
MDPRVKVLGSSVGIAIAIILGFILYGELTRPAGFEGVSEGMWVTGNGIKEGNMLEYKIDLANKSMIVNIRFDEKIDNNWKATITADGVSREVVLSENLVAVDIPENFEEWNDIRKSLFWIVDFVYEPRPLVGNSVWSTINLEFRTVELKLVAKEDISIVAGDFTAYKLAYYLGYQGGGELWIVKDMPLPVKAEVRDQDNDLIFRYELLSYSL